LVKIGGTASQRGSDGASIATDDQTSFRDLGTAIVGGIAAKGWGKATVEQQHTAQQANGRLPTVTTDPITGVQTVTQPAPAVIPEVKLFK